MGAALMGLDATQLRHEVVRPALESIDRLSVPAENLVMATAAQESHLEYIRQLGSGPALGLFQMEPATHDDIWTNYLASKPLLANLVRRSIETTAAYPEASRLAWDLRYAAIMCRIHYLRVPEALPPGTDVPAMAAYWKQHYNTPAGAGTVEEFVENYRRVGA